MSAVVTDETVETDEDREAIESMNENGRSIEDRADAGEHEDEEDDGTPQLILPGTGTKLSTSVGGKKPTESYFKMSGVALSIANNQQIAKDTEMWVAIPVAVDEVHVSNRRREGNIVAVKRVHLARAIGQPVILDKPPVPLD